MCLCVHSCIIYRVCHLDCYWRKTDANFKGNLIIYYYCMSTCVICFHVLCPKQQAAEDDVVLSTTGATCASVIITACFMESAVKTLKLNAPQVRLFFPDISPVLPVNVTLCWFQHFVLLITFYTGHMSVYVFQVFYDFMIFQVCTGFYHPCRVQHFIHCLNVPYNNKIITSV